MPADIKQILMDKGEMIALGVAGAILVGYLGVSFGMSGNNAELEAVNQKIAAAKNTLNSNPPPTLTRPDFSSIPAAWGADSVTAPAGKGSWVTISPPVVKADAKAAPVTDKPPVEPDRLVTTPVMGAAETGLGQVSLKWAAGKGPVGTPVARAKEYEIQRQEAGKGWVSLTKVAGGKTTHTDTTVEPKKKYAYKVRMLTVDKTIGGKTESDWSQSVEATVPSGVAIVYEGGGDKAAILTVRKFMGGEWREKKYTVFPKYEDENDPAKSRDGAVGKIEREKDDAGKWVEVDFRTGFVLLEIKKERFKYTKKEVKKTFNEKGELTGEVETEVPVERDRMKIYFTDDDGKAQEMWQKAAGEEDGNE